MSTVDDLIAQLTAAIDHPNPSPPPDWLAGTASPGDQVPVPVLIEQLRDAETRSIGADSAKTAAAAAATNAAAEYTARHAEWVARQPGAFDAWDRAVRSLENIVNGSAGPPIDVGNLEGAQRRTSSVIVSAKARKSPPYEAITALQANERGYFQSLQGEPQPNAEATRRVQLAASEAATASDALRAVTTRASQYITYLNFSI